MLFDTDKYIEEKIGNKLGSLEIEKTEDFDIRPPANKVPACNLPKLAPDKRIVPIVIDVKISNDLVFRDRFDWDVYGRNKLRPIEFARNLLQQLQTTVNQDDVREETLEQKA
jgi:hypothetical protein